MLKVQSSHHMCECPTPSLSPLSICRSSSPFYLLRKLRSPPASYFPLLSVFRRFKEAKGYVYMN
ncbi:hypothetical protein HanXRQr2_Chr01g0030791 [Helianthus annuus]|uniref:Uncharacterized protein n=1 Tax=Helianthus annuus TaxID=4232 RepID=A0A251VPP4_HELAN|nr:hypothetical protein HanXRQr2_Chr01g0030791 [Helianthus annuus]